MLSVFYVNINHFIIKLRQFLYRPYVVFCCTNSSPALTCGCVCACVWFVRSVKQQLVNSRVSCSTLSLPRGSVSQQIWSFLVKRTGLGAVWECLQVAFLHLPQENDTLPAFYSSTLFPLDVFSFPSSWPGCERFTCSLRIHTTVCPSIHPSVRPGLCSLTRVWFQAESTPCKTSRSQRLHRGSREGRGGAWPGFILGRLLCSWVSSGLGGPWAPRRDGWADPLTDDCVSPQAQRHGSQ